MNDLQAIRTLMSGSDPAATRPASAAEAGSVRTQVLEQPRSGHGSARRSSPGRPVRGDRSAPIRPRLRPALLLLIAGLALAVVGSAVLPFGSSGTRAVAATPPVLPLPVGAGGPAAPVLRAIADAARALPPATPAGPYRYVRAQSWGLNTAVAGGRATSVLSGTQHETWRLPDGTGRVRTTPGEDLVDLVGSRETLDALLRDRKATDRRISQDTSAQPLPDPAVISTVSPTAFARSVKPGANVNAPAGALVAQYVNELFSGQPVPPATRAAVWRLVATLPGASNRGTVLDRTGRHGVAITLDDDGSAHGLPERYLFVISQDDGQLLEQDTVLTTDPGKLNVKVPAVLELTVFVDAGYTLNDQDRP